ncbi:MAG: amidohydrolase family protein [Anaerolineales bacterium]
MPGLLIENGYLLTVNAIGDEYPHGYILIEDDLITCVSDGYPPDSIRDRASQVIDAAGQLVMPGLVNSHVHLFQTLIRGLSDNRPLIPWLEEVAFPVYENMRPEEIYLAVQMGIVENIRGGATAVTDDFTVLQPREGFEAVFRAAKESGIRYKMARGYSDTGYPEALMETREQVIASTIELNENWCKDDPMLSIDFSPNVVWSTTGETLEEVVGVARDHDLGIHIHTAEDKTENDLCLETNGLRQIPWLAEMGVLGPRTQLAHGIWVTEDDIDLIAASGTSVVHNPVSNMFIGTGICPADKMLQAGVNVALGTDGQAVNCGQEMLDVLKWTANLQKVNTLNPEVLPPEQVLQMACQNGAYAFGQPDLIGCLEPGKKADLVLINLDASRFSFPTLSIPSLLVNFARQEDVKTTIVNGKVLMMNNEILFLDEEELIRNFRQVKETLIKRAVIK